MKIRDVVCYAPPGKGARFSQSRFVIVLVKTDEGLTGAGEATLRFPVCLSGQVIAAIDGCREYLVGQDPRRIARLGADLYDRFFWRGGPVELTALGAIDQALWDILGQAAGMPVYQLLGGAYHENLPLYHNGWWRGAETTEEVIAKATDTIAKGAKRLKWYPFEFLPQLQDNFHVTNAQLKRAIDEVMAMREAVGPEIELMIDVWRRLDLNSAIRFCNAIEPAGLVFVEEAVFAENIDVMIRLARSVNVRLSTGERLLTKWEFRPLIEAQAVGIIQPDVPRVGGITEARKIAALAETFGISVAPHNPTGSIATAAAVHLCASIRNFTMLERFVPFDPDPFVAEDLTYRHDHIELPTRPGMGVTVDEDALKRLSTI